MIAALALPAMLLRAAQILEQDAGPALSDLRGFAPQGVVQQSALNQIYREAGEARVLYAGRAFNVAMLHDGRDVWGYDPSMLLRYAEFIGHTQGRDAETLDNVSGRPPRRPHRLLGLLRAEVLIKGKLAEPRSQKMPGALPRFLLLHEHRVVPDAVQALALLDSPLLDPWRVVVLEREPRPPPELAQEGASETIRVLSESTDHVDLSVEAAAAGVLLVTDAYDPGWSARRLAGSAQDTYELLVADHVLRAIPLTAGSHRIRMEYVPVGYRLGRSISLAFVALFGAVTVGWLWGRQ